MTDYTELKRLAEAQPVKEWSRDGGRQPSMPGRELMFYVEGPEGVSDYEDWGFTRSAASYIAAANPAAILALITENDRLKTLRSTTERDLAQELEVWRYGPSCWNCGDTGDVHDMVGEWRGQCDCNAAKLIDAASERDQLKAENAGLKTGYEAYERVNAELKAEVEKLRGVMACVASEVHSHTNHNGNAPGHCHSIPGIWDRDNGAKAGKECAWCKVWNYAAAIGKGEQS